jgi:hypothetical protein
MLTPHLYIDKSKRKPYICGVCGLDIKHPIHQPQLEGIRANTRTVEVDEPETDRPEQFDLFQPSLF